MGRPGNLTFRNVRGIEMDLKEKISDESIWNASNLACLVFSDSTSKIETGPVKPGGVIRFTTINPRFKRLLRICCDRRSPFEPGPFTTNLSQPITGQAHGVYSCILTWGKDENPFSLNVERGGSAGVELRLGFDRVWRHCLRVGRESKKVFVPNKLDHEIEFSALNRESGQVKISRQKARSFLPMAFPSGNYLIGREGFDPKSVRLGEAELIVSGDEDS